mmetsp:Transcript_7891/g.14991  ORF Transcript_7891/g.14991 Transcript_7891/m.14991 type:complete len:91 (+) Transcript_7891:155-427(+)|eukprot:CAMPEP_0114239916 /NCGR_PEP_ID=MMETSP0058-20121206/8735_1 /TAXON_ID=36894 /ORGANISM="Pyramimonas parkeae, CCMP726" /LENGTH=90 /DNA_ID=CAMNT_0001352169 /DNA_START=56 /DNA_END=328 /DNA_ORIENTATION=+
MEEDRVHASEIKPEFLHEVFKMAWERVELQGANKRATVANRDALKLAAEMVRQFVMEAVGRAAALAETEGDPTVEPSHLERILPQLLLDF